MKVTRFFWKNTYLCSRIEFVDNEYRIMNRVGLEYSVKRTRIILLLATLFSTILLVAIFLISMGIPGPHPITMLALFIPDGVLLWLPIVILWPRYKWTESVIIAVVTLFFYCNILYYRNFDTAISTQILSLASTVDSIVIRSALASTRWQDIIFLFPLLITVISTAVWGKKAMSISLPRHFKLLAVTGYMAIALIAQYRLYFITSRWNSDNMNIKVFIGIKTNFNSQLTEHGVSAGYIFDYLSSRSSFEEMPEEQINEIKGWNRAEGFYSTDSSADRNLIFIIVESLNTKAVEMKLHGRLIMPQINRLISDPTAITFTSVYPQAGGGRSSDGQMMYYSGIYPSGSIPMAVIAPEGPYPSLARIYPQDSFEIIYESRSLWNHGVTTKAFGFKKLHDNLERTGMDRSVSDSLVFAKAKKILPKAHIPFFSAIITIGMHEPYNRPFKKTWFSDMPFADSRDKNYLEACAAFDSALGDFIVWLKESGFWENSTIVIASDHEAREEQLSPEMSDRRLLLTILNSGHPGFTSNDIVGQIDVFPTLIDLTGLNHKFTWHGFGHSLLREIPGYAIAHDGSVVGDTLGKSEDVRRQEKAINLSQLWIKAKNKRQLPWLLRDANSLSMKE